ncbi:MAG: LytR/AlgR family response regulator transcription factor [Myxococcota bacterium]
MLRVLVADDELLARKRLHRLLGDMDDVEVVGDASDGAQVLKRVAQGDVDCVLLDIQMPHLTGLDALQLLPAGGASVVFVTAHAEHAVEAFDGDAVDYVLKPVQAERLARALDRVRARRDSPSDPALSDAPSDAHERLAVTTAKGLLLLSPTEITHALIEGETVEIHGDRGVIYTELRLAELERRLPTPPFERLHRRSLVNMDRIARLEPLSSGGYLAHTDLGAVVDVSRKAARTLRKRFGLS